MDVRSHNHFGSQGSCTGCLTGGSLSAHRRRQYDSSAVQYIKINLLKSLTLLYFYDFQLKASASGHCIYYIFTILLSRMCSNETSTWMFSDNLLATTSKK